MMRILEDIGKAKIEEMNQSILLAMTHWTPKLGYEDKQLQSIYAQGLY